MKLNLRYILPALLCLYHPVFGQENVTKQLNQKYLDALELAALENVGDLAIELIHPNISKKEEGPFFAYNTLKGYKVIFYDLKKSPMVYASVTFNYRLAVDSAVVDYTARNFSFREAFIRKMCLQASKVAANDSAIYTFKDAYHVIIPISTATGSKVYIYSRKEPGKGVLYGSEVVYTCDSTASIIRKEKPHRNDECLGYQAFDDPRIIIGVHNHINENEAEFTVADFATAILCNYDQRFKKMLMFEAQQVYEIDLITFEITKWTKEQYIYLYLPNHPGMPNVYQQEEPAIM